MACILFGMTISEALQGVTLNAAQALGLQKQRGSLEVGKMADLAIWNVNDKAALIYYLGAQPLQHLVKEGKMLAFMDDFTSAA